MAIVTVVLFMLIAGTAVAAASTGASVSAGLRVNTTLNQLIQQRANQLAATGYTSVAAVSGVTSVTLSLGSGGVSAVQSVTVNANGTAQVLVTVGKYIRAGVVPASSCSLNAAARSSNCLYADATATQDISTTVPTPAGFTPVVQAVTNTGRTKYAMVSTGTADTLALDASGQVWGWGSNSFGELCTGNTVVAPTPVKVFPGKTIVKIEAGYFTSYAIDSAGNLWACGLNTPGLMGQGSTSGMVASPVQIKPGTVWTQISSSGWLTFGVDSLGQAWGWGWNAGGLGVAAPSNTAQSTPTKILTARNIAVISAGWNGGAAIDTAGNWWAWGGNSSGQIGDGTTTTRHLPAQVGAGTVWTHVSAGFDSACGIDTYKYLWCTGANSFGQIGNGGTTAQTQAVRVGGATRFSTVNVGTQTVGAVDMSGQGWVFGRNDHGQLGLGDTVNRPSPTLLSATARFLAITPSTHDPGDQTRGGWVTAVDTSHYLWAWGNNASAGLADGTTAAPNRVAASRVEVGVTKVTQVVQVSGTFTIAIDSANRMFGWGNNWNGNAANGQAASTSTGILPPTQIAPQYRWARAFGVNGAVFAVTTDGRTFGWGFNGTSCNTQIGVGSPNPYVTTPTQLVGLPNWGGGPINIVGGGSGGDSAMFALYPAGVAGGYLYGWGGNGVGQLGIGSTVCQQTPVLVMTNVKKISTGAYYRNSFALRAGGDLYSTGENGTGTLGNGTSSGTVSWTQVPGSYVDVSAGFNSTSAIGTDGQAYGWGANRPGEWSAGGALTYVITSQSTTSNCVTTPQAVGCVDGITLVPGATTNVNVAGWAYARSGTNWSIDENIYVTAPSGAVSGYALSWLTGSNPAGYRGDVNSQQGISGNHGFNQVVPRFGLNAEGAWRFQFYAMTPAGNPLFADLTINVSAWQLTPRPIGSANGADSIRTCGTTTQLWNSQGGNVSGWGQGAYGVLGNGSGAPVQAPAISQTTTGPTQLISADSYSSWSGAPCTWLSKDGAGLVKGWGVNDFFVAAPTVGNVLSPTVINLPAVATLSIVLRPGGTDEYVSALTVAGDIYAWGANTNGAVTVPNSNTPVANPTKVTLPSPTVMAAQAGVVSTATMWQIGTITLGPTTENFQVDVETAYPVDGVGLYCAATGAKLMPTSVQPGSQSWVFGNVMVGDAIAAGSLTAASCPTAAQVVVYLEGEPLSAAEVRTRVLRVTTVMREGRG